jgi:L-galactono-1,4-lactone dehydrogenase
MSPAHSSSPEQVFSWVGVIMYLPSQLSTVQKEDITHAFRRYIQVLQPIYDEYGAVPHWAKIETPGTPQLLIKQREQLQARYDIAEFERVRMALDPHGILQNDLTALLLGTSDDH